VNQIHVGIGEYAVSSNQNDIIKTYALGSCVAIIMYDREKKTAALMHIALPESAVNLAKAQALPGYFVDTGLPLLLQETKKLGCTRRTAWIKLAGGSNIMDENRRFDIGKRNVLAIKKLLWKQQLGTIAEDVGGEESRTVAISVATGDITLSNSKRTWTL
jgi:chemotaxis protein CheD